MCITNELSEKTLKGIRAFESGEKEEKTLAETLAYIKVLSDCLEMAEKKIKKTMKESYSGEVHYIPEIQKKVFLSEGRSNVSYNIEEIQKKVSPEIFTRIVNIVAKKVEEVNDIFVTKTVNDYKSSVKGKAYITTTKMNKTELVEHCV